MRDAGYREALVAYIDILGFRKLIETSAVNPSTVPTLLNALSELKQQTSGGGRVIHWQLMGALEALNGMLLFGLTTAALFAIIRKVWSLRASGSR
jgi:hypothetical protein